jgi:NitT/TauT family transport system substrate-binding protein
VVLNRTLFILLVLYSLHAALFLASANSESLKLRVGHFPNITHAQALVARQLARRGEPWFEPRLNQQQGENNNDHNSHQPIEIEWYLYNAGPSAMEAIFAQALDISFVGPNPAINAHIKAAGKEIRVISGAAFGGSGLILRADLIQPTLRSLKNARSPLHNLAILRTSRREYFFKRMV